jgi:hypothetical protein
MRAPRLKPAHWTFNWNRVCGHRRGALVLTRVAPPMLAPLSPAICSYRERYEGQAPKGEKSHDEAQDWNT